MTATNMCSNFGGKWDSPPLKIATTTKKILPVRLSLEQKWGGGGGGN